MDKSCKICGSTVGIQVTLLNKEQGAKVELPAGRHVLCGKHKLEALKRVQAPEKECRRSERGEPKPIVLVREPRFAFLNLRFD